MNQIFHLLGASALVSVVSYLRVSATIIAIYSLHKIKPIAKPLMQAVRDAPNNEYPTTALFVTLTVEHIAIITTVKMRAKQIPANTEFAFALLNGSATINQTSEIIACTKIKIALAIE